MSCPGSCGRSEACAGGDKSRPPAADRSCRCRFTALPVLPRLFASRSEHQYCERRRVMDTVEKQSPGAGQGTPVEIIETCWRLRGPSGRTLNCVIYRNGSAAIEVRAGYGFDDPLSTLAVGSTELARAHAEGLRRLMTANREFERLPDGLT